MVTQEDTIFVSGMDPGTDEMAIETHFGAIGIIKVSSQTYIYIIYHYANFNVFNLLFIHL